MATRRYLLCWSVVLAIGNFHFSYYNNIMLVLWDFFPCIYNFEPNERRFRNALATLILPASSILGSALSWIFVKYGKRKTLIIHCVFIIIAIGISMIQNYEAFVVSRAIIGLSFGVGNAISPIFIKDVVRKNDRGPMITLVQLFLNFGFLMALSLAFILPSFEQPFKDIPDY
mmetsp:Transcript_20413/g.18072  ORF Transcript_20413/g.18072 Transcript_20413/m.18072 type:complete len:172 (-) Transcript_20413:979-1494(-)